MSDKSRIIDRIKKCLALAGSDNPHEAEAALRQAHKLMVLYDLDSLDIELSEISKQELCEVSSIPKWREMLYVDCAYAFGCKVLVLKEPKLNSGKWSTTKIYSIVGSKSDIELATYAASVLSRQLDISLRNFMLNNKENLRRSVASEKNTFCKAWVCAVGSKISQFADSSRGKKMESIAQYLAKQNPGIKNKKSRPVFSDSESKFAARLGMESGKKASLHGAVTSTAEVPIGIEDWTDQVNADHIGN